ncbi:MAG: GNAT family N-acetyltransferase [Pseudomonadota bacterium]
MNVSVVETLSEVAVEQWDRLAGANPFMRHGFLYALEVTDCLGPQGWYPYYILIRRNERLVAALAVYARDNSYGEFVFDWSWADAYERAGGRYYPKLVTAVPFSPVVGPRLLIDESAADPQTLAQHLIAAAIEICEQNELSSWHCLFPEESELDYFDAAGLARRLGCQYQWFNDDYQSFDDFLSQLSSKKRKEIRRERRKVNEQGVAIEALTADDIKPHHWEVFYRYYCATFHRKWGEPRFTLEFFKTLNDHLPGSAVLILASHDEEYVAGAFALRDESTLYGRHWGCSSYFDNLHFELCYYQTIDFCITHGLKRLDAGVQGEHKLARGFVPVKTWSAHWIRDERFRQAIDSFVLQEQRSMQSYIESLDGHTAFKRGQG